MATFNKFEQFVTDLAAGVHVNALNADTDTLNVYLSNDAPSASLDLIKTDLAEITNENGYLAPEDVQNAATETTGTITVVGTDVVITASGGTVGPFQYAVLYNDTPSSPVDPLIGWWDYGSAITLQDGETFTIDFGASLFTVS
jgi:hypothetical protein